jgi:Tol biopolymer transport system component
MAATHLSNNFQLHLAAVADAGNPKVLISARTVTFAPDDQLVYSDDGDLWTINHDGANQRQLTSNAFNDFSPRVSPDGRYIFFASNRAGSNQVWRMNADGSDQIQLTHSEGGYPMMVTPDGNYVYFLSGLHQTLWQVAVDGGKETQLWDQSVYAPAFSPDGKLVAYVRDPHRAAKLEIINLADHRSLQNFALNGGAAEISKMVWANSAKSLIYINANGPRKSLWEQPLDGAAPRMIAELGNDEIEDLAVSTDGHTLSFIRGKWIHTVVLIEGLKVN